MFRYLNSMLTLPHTTHHMLFLEYRKLVHMMWLRAEVSGEPMVTSQLLSSTLKAFLELFTSSHHTFGENSECKALNFLRLLIRDFHMETRPPGRDNGSTSLRY